VTQDAGDFGSLPVPEKAGAYRGKNRLENGGVFCYEPVTSSVSIKGQLKRSALEVGTTGD
jgi:hypothetical protein